MELGRIVTPRRHPGWPAVLVAGAVGLRAPHRSDAAQWCDARRRNEAWLTPWEPTSPVSWAERSTPATWRALVVNLNRTAKAGGGLPFVIVYGGRLVGQMNVSNIVHGALRSANVGYWVDAAVAGRGITPTALALVIDHCFSSAGLHRIEVDIRPENRPSRRVVEKLGLRQEGYYERFLNIDNGWRDHLAFAVTVEELRGTTMLSRLAGLPLPPG